MLRDSADVALSAKPGGCMLILGVVNCLPDSGPVRDCLMNARQDHGPYPHVPTARD